MPNYGYMYVYCTEQYDTVVLPATRVYSIIVINARFEPRPPADSECSLAKKNKKAFVLEPWYSYVIVTGNSRDYFHLSSLCALCYKLNRKYKLIYTSFSPADEDKKKPFSKFLCYHYTVKK